MLVDLIFLPTGSFPFYGLETSSAERLGAFPKVTQLISGQAGMMYSGTLDALWTAFCLWGFPVFVTGFHWAPGFRVTDILKGGHLAFQMFHSDQRGCLVLGTDQGIWNQRVSVKHPNPPPALRPRSHHSSHGTLGHFELLNLVALMDRMLAIPGSRGCLCR